MDSWLDWSEIELASPPTQLEQARATQDASCCCGLFRVWTWLDCCEALEALEKHLDQRVPALGSVPMELPARLAVRSIQK